VNELVAAGRFASVTDNGPAALSSLTVTPE
jgi:hypothetical protein